MGSYKFMRRNKNHSLRIYKLSEYLSSFNGLPTINTGAVERGKALESGRALLDLLMKCDLKKGYVTSPI